MSEHLRVYVPNPQATHPATGLILPGSAIVGSPQLDGDFVMVDYEGNKYGWPALASFDDKLLHAAGRHVQRYPTVARMVLPTKELLQVGWYEYDPDGRNYVLTVERPAHLRGWQERGQ